MGILSLLMLACGTTRPSTSQTKVPPPPPTRKPEPQVPVEVPPPPVVIKPTEPKPTPKDPTKLDPKEGQTEARVAQVSMIMPFFANQFVANGEVTLPQNSEWALQYYAGLRLGLVDLEKAGQKANIHIFDSEGDAGVAQRLVADPELRQSHALIAPYLTDAVKAVVTPAKAAGLPLIVPFSATADLASDYPEMVQMNPGLPTHLDALATYLHATYEPNQVVLLGLPTGEQNQLVSYLKNRQRVLNPNGPAWRTWRLESSSDAMSGLQWEGKFVDGKTTVFVFPIYNRPELINGFMSQLELYRHGREVELVGMPQWAEFRQLDPSLMESHHVTITSGPLIDWDSYVVREFTDRYVDKYGALPELPAFLGYDAITYAVPIINKYGINWTKHLPKTFNGLVSDYAMRPQYAGEASGAVSERQPSRIENTSIEVLHFRNFGFTPEVR